MDTRGSGVHRSPQWDAMQQLLNESAALSASQCTNACSLVIYWSDTLGALMSFVRQSVPVRAGVVMTING